jgi:uncharacterized membrane protein YfcA
MEQSILLIFLGVLVGTYGTLIGAGGGFVLVPILLLLYPSDSPITITTISLAVVFFNALSGSLAYTRMKRIDFKSGLLLAAATIPGAILGALTIEYIPRRQFEGIFGILLGLGSIFLVIFPVSRTISCPGNGKYHITIELVDADGKRHHYGYNYVTGLMLSFFVGYLSSLLGIGGGIIHVPALVYMLNFPVHIATATSHFILAVMTLTGTVVHVVNGDFAHGIHRTICLALGVLVGAQIGARLSNRFHGVWIIRGLALALGIVGIRILINAF